MNINLTNPELLKTKQHFEILDGLRGIAAIAVVIFHYMEWVYTDFKLNFIGHGFLAVDFFFCLSGFVIAYAYDDRISKIGIKEFFKARLIRLHPLIVLGSLLGLLAFLFDPFASSSAAYSGGRLLLIFLCSAFLIPFPVMEERAFNLFGLNAPSWSLFWEYVANIFYVFILYKTGKKTLLILTLIAAAVLCYVGYRTGNLLGGWTGSNFWDGGARVAFSFLAGILIYRSNWIIKNRLGFFVIAVLLSFAFITSFFKWNWVAEVIVVLFYFPLIVSLGAGSTLSPVWKKLCTFLGNISYPLYMTHYAGIWAFGNYFTKSKPATNELGIIVVGGTILMIGVAWLIMTLYDIPLRRYLNQKRKQKTVV